MINYLINEITVWADSLEDQNIDVSLLRLLCTNNYLVCQFFYGQREDYGVGDSWTCGSGNMPSGDGDGNNKFTVFFDRYFRRNGVGNSGDGDEEIEENGQLSGCGDGYCFGAES